MSLILAVFVMPVIPYFLSSYNIYSYFEKGFDSECWYRTLERVLKKIPRFISYLCFMRLLWKTERGHNESISSLPFVDNFMFIQSLRTNYTKEFLQTPLSYSCSIILYNFVRLIIGSISFFLILLSSDFTIFSRIY